MHVGFLTSGAVALAFYLTWEIATANQESALGIEMALPVAAFGTLVSGVTLLGIRYRTRNTMPLKTKNSLVAFSAAAGTCMAIVLDIASTIAR
jgi:hypothetical protein